MGRLVAARREILAPAALLLFCTLWRLPTLGDPPWLNDEGTYATVGRAIFNGELLYRQVWENKPPGIYLLYGAVETIAGAMHVLLGMRILALIAALVVQIAVYGLIRPRAGMATALLGIAIAGVALDLPLLDGTSANAEIFLAAATASGMWLLWRGLDSIGDRVEESGMAVRQARGLFLLAGVAFGAAIVIKLVAGADLVAAAALIGLLLPSRRVVATGLLLAGAAIPVGAIVLWLLSRGILGDAAYATVGYNRGYVSTGQGMHVPIVSVVLLLVPIVLVAAGVWLLIRLRRAAGQSVGSAVRLIAGSCVWLGLALLGALASGRSYPHYYLQAVPPLAVVLPLIVSRADERREQAARTALAILLAAWVVLVPLSSWLAVRGEPANDAPGSRQYAYYAYVWQHLTGRLDDTEYGNRIDARVERNVAVAQYLRTHPVEPRRLYVWGNTPWIYYLSGYEHAARFLSAYYNPPIPGGMDQVIRSLQADPPPYIVAIEPPLPPSAALQAFIRSRYSLVWSVLNARVYRLRTVG